MVEYWLCGSHVFNTPVYLAAGRGGTVGDFLQPRILLYILQTGRGWPPFPCCALYMGRGCRSFRLFEPTRDIEVGPTHYPVIGGWHGGRRMGLLFV